MSIVFFPSLFLLSQVASYSQAFSSAVVGETEVCPGTRGLLHTIYDNRRSPINKVADGLGLMKMITGHATEDGVNYFPDLNTTGISRKELRKLIKVIQLPFFIANRPLRERIGFEAPTGALDTVAKDLCDVIKEHLSGVYKAFTCSEEELKDLDGRLAYADLLENYYETIKSVQDPAVGSQNREAFQCQHWNTRGVDGCMPGQNVAPEVSAVQEHVVRPLYSQYCNCEALEEPSPICNIVES